MSNRALTKRNDLNSELRMVSAVVDEHGDGATLSKAFRLKAAYANDPKRMEQVLDTFPMSSVLKKVRFTAGIFVCVCARESF